MVPRVIKYLVDVACHPINALMRQEKFSWEQDIKLWWLMNTKQIPVYNDEFVATFQIGHNHVEIWVGNFPYSYGHDWRVNGHQTSKSNQRAPRTSTAHAFQKYLKNFPTSNLIDRANAYTKNHLHKALTDRENDMLTVRVRTSELTGIALDWAVAKCENSRLGTEQFAVGVPLEEGQGLFNPSMDWILCRNIIEREGIVTKPDTGLGWWVAATSNGSHIDYGPTPMVASMRCYVASKLGDFIDVPERFVS